MPDEQSNLNLPPAARRPNNRRRGRRGGRGRGRGPRPADESVQTPATGEVSNPAETSAETGVTPETQTEFTEQPQITAAPRSVENEPPIPTAAETPPVARPQPVHQPRHERRPDSPPPKPWIKPADFRPADTSAIHQAVVHATEIAEGLRELVDRIDEILELVEVAERQKLADERELDNLRRALRRIQPPRQMSSHEPHRGQSRGDSRPRQDYPPSRPESGRAHEPTPAQASHSEEGHGSEGESHGESADGQAESHDESHVEERGEELGEEHSGESHPES